MVSGVSGRCVGVYNGVGVGVGVYSGVSGVNVCSGWIVVVVQ